MAVAAGAVALGICFATGLPGDWARRRAAGGVAVFGQVITAVGVGAIAIVGAAGWLHGFGSVAALVVGIVAGEAAANQVATHGVG
jgi:hypothetical protein